MAGLYERQRAGKIIFLSISIALVVLFVLISNSLVRELGRQERERMDIWAQATQRLARTDLDNDYEFLLSIISQNNTIPVLIADEDYNVLDYRNFDLPDKKDSMDYPYTGLSKRNQDYLHSRLMKATANKPMAEMLDNPHFIEVEGVDNGRQYIYFEDSRLLKRLSLYPYIQLVVMVVLAIVIYIAVIYTKRAEQNRVWAGLSKETAHQLGTPISSLMAWTEYLEQTGIPREVTSEIDKDVKRLSVIAERFSKIGSVPELKLVLLNQVVVSSLDYMRKRISGKVSLSVNTMTEDAVVNISKPLFEWVMENLTKNAVDAMKGEGQLIITTGSERDKVFIEVSDTGKGIARKNFKNVFNPGFTTKKRGWGLGLTLTKRIIEAYHGGRIFVKESELGRGTTFRIELPIAPNSQQN